MAFSEALKLKVKRQAAFRCCRCQSIGVEIHHIVPQSENGLDTIDNAAPLCSSCHADFGDNPNKRKEIRQMRDWWYERASEMYGRVDPKYVELVSKLDALITAGKENANYLNEIKSTMRQYADLLVQQVTPENAKRVASELVNIEKPPFVAGLPCQMSGQPCPAASCVDGIMDIDPSQAGVVCNKCGLFIPA